MTLYAGIDVGQSGTTASIGDGERVIAHGHAGAGDEVGQDAGSTRLHDAMRVALADAAANAQLPHDVTFAAIVAGISGYEGRVTGAAPRLPSANVTLMHDAPIAHAAAFGAAPGIIVIAGTGSVAYTRARDGRMMTAGGWGYLFGDEGSAFWIARTAFGYALACEDRCAAGICAYFGCDSMRETARSFYSGAIGRDRFASLAHRAFGEASIHCVQRAALRAPEELATLARSAVLDPFDETAVAFTGGLMLAPQLAKAVLECAQRTMPGASLAVSTAMPADGALFLASRA